MGEYILATQQYINKAKELVEDIINRLEDSCEAFDLTDEERSKVLDKFMCDLLIPNLKDIYINSLRFALWGDEPNKRIITNYNPIYRRRDTDRLEVKE